MDDNLPKLVLEWEQTARRADEVAGRVELFTRVGVAVPAELLLEMAKVEDQLLEKLLAVRRARGNDEPLH